MAYCPDCGRNVDNDDRFCRYCGKRLKDGSQPDKYRGELITCKICDGLGYSWMDWDATEYHQFLGLFDYETTRKKKNKVVCSVCGGTGKVRV